MTKLLRIPPSCSTGAAPVCQLRSTARAVSGHLSAATGCADERLSTAAHPGHLQAGSNKVAGLGIPERWALILPYLPFWLAIVAAVAELLLLPRTESKVRFHAARNGVANHHYRNHHAADFRRPCFRPLGLAVVVSIGEQHFPDNRNHRVWKGKPFHVAAAGRANEVVE